MATGYNMQLTRQIGEHLVVAELGKRGITATPFAGNIPYYDVLAANENGQSIPIQVKAINGGSWQFNITKFLNIEFLDDRQIIKGMKDFKYQNLICVFVLLNSTDSDEFYIFHWSFLQKFFYKNYTGGIRPRNPKSTHCAILPKDLVKFKDNWSLITKKLL